MEREGQKTCAMFIVNRSDYIFESTMSSIMRTFESFKLDELLVFYAGFTRNLFKAQGNKHGFGELFEWIRGKGIEVRAEEFPSMNDVEEFKKWIDEKTKGCEEIIAIPTTSASLTAYLLGRLEDERLTTISYVFAFGPWTNYFYPYVPRPLEEMRVIEGKAKASLDTSKLEGFPNYMSENTFNMNVENVVIELNKEPTEDEVLELYYRDGNSDKVLLSSDTFDLNDFLNKLRRKFSGDEETIHEILLLSGAFELKFTKGKEHGTISSLTREKVLIDTNMLFYGIHNYELRNLIVPKCVRNEVSINSVQMKSRKGLLKSALSEVVEDVLNSILSHAKLIPSEDLWCDIAIPKIDPDLIEGAYLLTGDKKAFQRWTKSTLSKYTESLLVDVPNLDQESGVKKYSESIKDFIVKDKPRRYMSIITIALILSKVRTMKVSLGWKGQGKIEVSYS